MTIEFGKEIKDNAKDVGEESKEVGKQFRIPDNFIALPKLFGYSLTLAQT